MTALRWALAPALAVVLLGGCRSKPPSAALVSQPHVSVAPSERASNAPMGDGSTNPGADRGAASPADGDAATLPAASTRPPAEMIDPIQQAIRNPLTEEQLGVPLYPAAREVGRERLDVAGGVELTGRFAVDAPADRVRDFYVQRLDEPAVTEDAEGVSLRVPRAGDSYVDVSIRSRATNRTRLTVRTLEVSEARRRERPLIKQEISAAELGVPLYPGARHVISDRGRRGARRVLSGKYATADPAAKVLDWYRQRLPDAETRDSLVGARLSTTQSGADIVVDVSANNASSGVFIRIDRVLTEEASR